MNINSKNDEVKKIQLQEFWRQFKIAQIKTTERIADFIYKKRDIDGKTSVNNKVITEAQLVQKILRYLIQKFHMKKKKSFNLSRILIKMTIDQLKDELLFYEILLDQHSINIVEKGLQAQEILRKIKESLQIMLNIVNADRFF